MQLPDSWWKSSIALSRSPCWGPGNPPGRGVWQVPCKSLNYQLAKQGPPSCQDFSFQSRFRPPHPQLLSWEQSSQGNWGPQVRRKYKTTSSAVLARNPAASKVILDRRIKILFLEHPKSSRGDSSCSVGHFPLPNPLSWTLGALPMTWSLTWSKDHSILENFSQDGAHLGRLSGDCEKQRGLSTGALGQQFSKTPG